MAYPDVPAVPPIGGAISGTLQNAATATGNGSAIPVVGMATAIFKVSTTGFSGTVTFQAGDGTDYSNVLCTELDTTTVADTTGSLTTDTSVSYWVAQVAGLTSVLAPITRSAGSVTVKVFCSAMPNAVPVGSTIGTAVIQASSGHPTTASADGLTASQTLEVAQGRFNGATIDRVRTFTKMVLLDEQAVTSDTPVDVLTPTSGKKFRIIAYHLVNSAATAGAIQIQSVSGTNLIVCPSGSPSPDLGQGVPADAADHHMFVDATQTGNISGWIGYTEE